MKELRNIADYKTRRCCINIDEYRKFENKGKLINNLIDILINVVKGELWYDRYKIKKNERNIMQ